MTNYEVRNPNDVRPINERKHEYKLVGFATVRPATDAEKLYFGPLHAALRAQSRRCAAAHWEHKMAARKAVAK